MKNLKYYIAAFLGGIVAKMYDDIFDNKKLEKYKSEFILELLKGLHYIFFTIISLKAPFFFIIMTIVGMLSYISCKNEWNNSYEKSLLITFSILLLFIDYKDINLQNFIIAIRTNYYCCLATFIEAYFIKE